MFYLWVKFIHILSSTILFGTGIGTAAVMLYAHKTQDIHIIAAITRYVVFADWIFTSTSAIVQLLSGLFLVHLAHYSLASFWLWGALIGYFIAAICWFMVVYLQIKMRQDANTAFLSQSALPKRYFLYFNYWFLLGWPAFISLLIIFYLMVQKPV